MVSLDLLHVSARNRLGASGSGPVIETKNSAGLGYYTRKSSNLFGIGLNWSRPSKDTFGDGLRDQYTAEIYYRVQLLKVLTITPDVQLVYQPALNPDQDLIAIFGLRGRLSF